MYSRPGADVVMKSSERPQVSFRVPNERRFCARWGDLTNASRSTPYSRASFRAAIGVLRLVASPVAQDNKGETRPVLRSGWADVPSRRAPIGNLRYGMILTCRE